MYTCVCVAATSAFASALDVLVREILDTDMQRFARFAEEEYQKSLGA